MAYKNEAQRRRADFRGRDLRRALDFARRDFLGFSAAASSRRRLAAQLGLLAWRPRAMASASAGGVSGGGGARAGGGAPALGGRRARARGVRGDDAGGAVV